MFHDLARIEVLSRHSDFEPPRVLSGLLPQNVAGADVLFMRYFVSRLKDATAEVLATLRNVPKGAQPPGYPS